MRVCPLMTAETVQSYRGLEEEDYHNIQLGCSTSNDVCSARESPPYLQRTVYRARNHDALNCSPSSAFVDLPSHKQNASSEPCPTQWIAYHLYNVPTIPSTRPTCHLHERKPAFGPIRVEPSSLATSAEQTRHERVFAAPATTTIRCPTFSRHRLVDRKKHKTIEKLTADAEMPATQSR